MENENHAEFSCLPEGCIANILSLTSPKDACRLSLVSSTFKSAADSDAVWDIFLPADYRDFLSQALDFLPSYSSKKQLFFTLCHDPLFIDQGNKGFWLEKTSGKKCIMSCARDLNIVWSDTPRYWNWISVPQARFREAAELISVCWLEIRGRINSSMLSLNAAYSAYFVYTMTTGCYGFEDLPLEVEIGYGGSVRSKRAVILDANRGRREQYTAPRRSRRVAITMNRRLFGVEESGQPSEDVDSQFSKKREDGWYEIEVGDFFNNEDNRQVDISILEVKNGNWKGGIVVYGIELRPKDEQ